MKPFHHLARGILSKENKILVAHAIGYKNTFLPGGHIEFGESAKDALIREVREELGVSCVVSDFLGLVEHKWMKRGVLNCEINQIFSINSEILQVSTSPKSMEPHIEFFWCSEDELGELQPYPLRKIINNLLKGNKEPCWESTLNNKLDDPNIN
ncbi:NUDIX domain-containing protein [Ornithinibacillus sp. L9]|uniref:NUDIX domain-containing protein n=1 Tax=Ornithinibacillus caprae TaxID=2678566 RepID=A0A6N8FFD9_9BACI|nr:NUDIX domain-containing protein [Ornithinibacillus caprae]MUK87911.1 NUDIX domain-containing protein [Ornithinibacillus caprae]